MKRAFKIVSAVLLLAFAFTGCGTKSADGDGSGFYLQCGSKVYSGANGKRSGYDDQIL